MKEILSILAQEWHSLNEEQKQLYRDESIRDKIIEDEKLGILSSSPQQMQMLGLRGSQLSNSALGLPPTNGNSNGEPFKKPMTPYMCFLKEQTALLSQAQAQVVMKDLVKYGAQHWNIMSD
jgi:hypothetical protein